MGDTEPLMDIRRRLHARACRLLVADVQHQLLGQESGGNGDQQHDAHVLDGLLDVDQELVAGTDLETRLKTLLVADPEMAVQLKADYRVAYGHIAQVMAAVSRAGIVRLSFVTSSDRLDEAL